jgi:hypothetical protein
LILSSGPWTVFGIDFEGERGFQTGSPGDKNRLVAANFIKF